MHGLGKDSFYFLESLSLNEDIKLKALDVIKDIGLHDYIEYKSESLSYGLQTQLELGIAIDPQTPLIFDLLSSWHRDPTSPQLNVKTAFPLKKTSHASPRLHPTCAAGPVS